MRFLASATLGLVSGVVLLASLADARASAWTMREVEDVAVWTPGTPAFIPTPSAPFNGHRLPPMPELPPGTLIFPLGGGAFLVNPLDGPRAWFVVTATASDPSPPMEDVGRVVSAARLEDGRIAVGAGPHDPMLWLETLDGSGFEVNRRVPFHAAFLVGTGDRFLLLDDSKHAVALFVDPDTGAPSQGPEVAGRVLDAIADTEGRVFVRRRWSAPLGRPSLTSPGLWVAVGEAVIIGLLLRGRAVSPWAFGVAAILGYVLTPVIADWLWPPVIHLY